MFPSEVGTPELTFDWTLGKSEAMAKAIREWLEQFVVEFSQLTFLTQAWLLQVADEQWENAAEECWLRSYERLM